MRAASGGDAGGGGGTPLAAVADPSETTSVSPDAMPNSFSCVSGEAPSVIGFGGKPARTVKSRASSGQRGSAGNELQVGALTLLPFCVYSCRFLDFRTELCERCVCGDGDGCLSGGAAAEGRHVSSERCLRPPKCHSPYAQCNHGPALVRPRVRLYAR